MSSSPQPNRTSVEIVDELGLLKEQIQHSLESLKQSGNPTQILRELSSRPKFALYAFALGGLGVAFLGFQLLRMARNKGRRKKLPKSLQKQLPLLQEALDIPHSSKHTSVKAKQKLVHTAGKSLAQVVWKAATPLLISFLRKNLGKIIK